MIKVSATLYKVEYDNLKKVLTYFFGLHNLKIKSRIIGEEFKYKDLEIDFFCYSSLDKKWKDKEENFIIDAFLKMDQNKTLSFISSLSSVLEREGIIYDFEYTEQDEDGYSLGEEVSQRHPDYTEFMKMYYGA